MRREGEQRYILVRVKPVLKPKRVTSTICTGPQQRLWGKEQTNRFSRNCRKKCCFCCHSSFRSCSTTLGATALSAEGKSFVHCFFFFTLTPVHEKHFCFLFLMPLKISMRLLGNPPKLIRYQTITWLVECCCRSQEEGKRNWIRLGKVLARVQRSGGCSKSWLVTTNVTTSRRELLHHLGIKPTTESTESPPPSPCYQPLTNFWHWVAGRVLQLLANNQLMGRHCPANWNRAKNQAGASYLLSLAEKHFHLSPRPPHNRITPVNITLPLSIFATAESADLPSNQPLYLFQVSECFYPIMELRLICFVVVESMKLTSIQRASFSGAA